MTRLFTFLLSLVTIGLTAQNLDLVADINPQAQDGLSVFDSGISQWDRYYFVGKNDETGKELYKLEEGEISLIKDINPGDESSLISHFSAFNGEVYFIATDGSNGNKVWKSNGTSEGTNIAFEHPIDGNVNYLTAIDAYGLYYRIGSNLYFYNGSTNELVTSVGIAFDSNTASYNATTTNDGMAIVNISSGKVTLTHVVGNTATNYEMAISGSTSSAKVTNVYSFEGGIAFSLFKNFSEYTGIHVFKTSDSSFTRVTEKDAFRGKSFDHEYALIYNTNGYYFFSSNHPNGRFIAYEKPSLNAGEPWMAHKLEDKIVFHSHTDFGDDIISTLSVGNPQINNIQECNSEIAKTSFVKDGKLFFAEGVGSGATPIVYYYDQSTGAVNTLFELNVNATSLDFLLPMTAQGNKIYFSSVYNPEFGREVYSYDLDFDISNVLDTQIEGVNLVPLNNSYRIENIENKHLDVRVYNMQGQLVHTKSISTSEYIDWQYAGIYILEVSDGKNRIAKRIFR